MRPTAITLFSGVGGMDTGLTQAGFQVIRAIEWEDQLAKILAVNHPNTEVTVDDIFNIHKVDHVDLLHASPPCQAYSSANQNRPTKVDTVLEKHIITLIRRSSPKIVTIENVWNYLHSDNCKLILSYLTEKYTSVQILKMKADEYGGATIRQRLFIIATSLPGSLTPIKKDRTFLTDLLYPLKMKEVKLNDRQLAAIQGRVNKNCFVQRRGARNQKAKVVEITGSFPTITASMGHDKKLKKSGCPSFTSPWTFVIDYSIDLVGYQLGAIELGLIQGFPADYNWLDEEGSACKGIGNAVEVNVARAIGDVCRKLLE